MKVKLQKDRQTHKLALKNNKESPWKWTLSYHSKLKKNEDWGIKKKRKKKEREREISARKNIEFYNSIFSKSVSEMKHLKRKETVV